MLQLRTTIVTASPDPGIDSLQGLSPSERLLGLYAYAIQGCARGSREEVTAALDELTRTLNPDYGEITQAFERLYAFCLAKVADGELDQVAWILGDLHETWSRAFSEAPTDPTRG
jgi:hypothetical protein